MSDFGAATSVVCYRLAVMLPRSSPVKVLTSPVLPPTERASGTTEAICTRSRANAAVVYSLTAPRGRRYLG